MKSDDPSIIGQTPEFLGRAIGVAGVGLIGGSIAAAVRSRNLFRTIVGFGRSHERLEAAWKCGLIDQIGTGDAACWDEIDLFVSCVPVGEIANSLRHAATQLSPGSLLTDAGSVKEAIIRSVGASPAPGVHFVGAHPLAGSEKQGHEFADGNLFADRLCVICPPDSPTDVGILARQRIEHFWRAIGCRVVACDAQRHDLLLARTSHLPHVAAAAVAMLLPADGEQFAATGFRDTTRIAAGDPALWADILLQNRDAVLGAVEELIAVCGEFRALLVDSNRTGLEKLLSAAKKRRTKFDEIQQP